MLENTTGRGRNARVVCYVIGSVFFYDAKLAGRQKAIEGTGIKKEKNVTRKYFGFLETRKKAACMHACGNMLLRNKKE